MCRHTDTLLHSYRDPRLIEQRQLLRLFARQSRLRQCQLLRQRGRGEAQPLRHTPAAGEKVLCPFHHHA